MYDDLINDIAPLVEHLNGLTEQILPIYSDFTDDVEHDRMQDINEIEHTLDHMLSFCFDKRVLSLYKQILRKIYPEYPELVEFHVGFYRKMCEDESIPDCDG